MGAERAEAQTVIDVARELGPIFARRADERTNEDEFVALRRARDARLPMPKLILHALQINIAGGRLPEPEDNGRRYLKLPLDAFAGARWD